jgi:hypothetical protein
MGCCRTVDRRRSSQSLPKGGVVVTKSTEGRHTVDRKGWRHQIDKNGGCRHQADKGSLHSGPKGLPSPSQQEVDVVTKSTRGRHTVDQRSGDTKSTQGAGTPSQPRCGDTKSTQGAGTPSHPKEWGHQVNPGAGTPSQPTEQGEGTPSQPTERGRGHQVNPRKSRRAFQLID